MRERKRGLKKEREREETGGSDEGDKDILEREGVKTEQRRRVRGKENVRLRTREKRYAWERVQAGEWRSKQDGGCGGGHARQQSSGCGSC